MSPENIKPLIQEAVKSSMKSGDKEKTTTLRMAISEIKKEEIDKVEIISNFKINKNKLKRKYKLKINTKEE